MALAAIVITRVNGVFGGVMVYPDIVIVDREGSGGDAGVSWQ